MNRFNLNTLGCHLLLASLLFIVACTRSGNRYEPDDLVVVHGNPLTLVEGTNLRPNSNLPKSLFVEGKKYFLIPRSFVRHSRVRTRTSWEQVKEDNRTDKMSRKDQREMLELLSLVATFDASGNSVTLSNSKLNLVFTKREGNWQFETIRNQSATFNLGKDYETIHYSHNENGAFSILIREQEDAMTALTFMPLQGGRNFAEDGSPYQYLYGKGFPVAWKDTTSLDVIFCNPSEHRFERLTRESLEAWKIPLKDRLDLRMSTKRCAPFSDVNERGIYLADVYMITPHTTERGTGGITVPNFDPTIGKLYDSDIFIMRSELYTKKIKDTPRSEAYSTAEQRTLLKRIITHELGHLFGVGHNFEGASIMNYDYHLEALTSYDVAAVQHLYPERVAINSATIPEPAATPEPTLTADNPDEQ